MVGEKAFAVLIDSQSNVDTLVDWRRGECPLKHTKIELPDKVLKTMYLFTQNAQSSIWGN